MSTRYLSDAAMGGRRGSVMLGIQRWQVRCMSKHLSTPWHMRSSICGREDVERERVRGVGEGWKGTAIGR